MYVLCSSTAHFRLRYITSFTNTNIYMYIVQCTMNGNDTVCICCN